TTIHVWLISCRHMPLQSGHSSLCYGQSRRPLNLCIGGTDLMELFRRPPSGAAAAPLGSRSLTEQRSESLRPSKAWASTQFQGTAFRSAPPQDLGLPSQWARESSYE